jgi:hypothetical protein
MSGDGGRVLPRPREAACAACNQVADCWPFWTGHRLPPVAWICLPCARNGVPRGPHPIRPTVDPRDQIHNRFTGFRVGESPAELAADREPGSWFAAVHDAIGWKPERETAKTTRA